MTEYITNGKIVSYTYGADNLRASKTVNGERTDFAWNGQNLAIEDTDGIINTYIYDPTGVHITNQNGKVVSYLKDWHNNIVGTVKPNGIVVESSDARQTYDSWGNILNSADFAPFGYTGEYHDAETGLIYLRNRYYDPETGRFISEDPIKDGLNWYTYCYNNPIVYIDYTGEAPRPYEPDKWNNRDIQPRTNCYAYAFDWLGEITYGNYVGTQLHSRPSETFAAQPGMLRNSVKTLLLKHWKCAKDVDMQKYSFAGALLDSIGNNHTFEPATTNQIEGKNLGENEWVVYLVATSGWGDYHWYRQNADENGVFDGTWSHKPGSTPVTNREFLGIVYNNVVLNESGQIMSMDDPIYQYGDIITDPTQISRSSTTYYYDTNGKLIRSVTTTYDKVVGAYVVGSK